MDRSIEAGKVQCICPVVAAVQKMKAVASRLHLEIREGRAIHSGYIALVNYAPERVRIDYLLLLEIELAVRVKTPIL